MTHTISRLSLKGLLQLPICARLPSPSVIPGPAPSFGNPKGRA